MVVDLSILIVNWNTRELLLSCLHSVFETVRELDFEVWLVDNASTDGSVEAVEARFPSVNVIRNPSNLGFAAANNLALERMRGRYALLLNTDATLTPGALQGLVSFMDEHPEAAAACGQLLHTDGSLQNSVANFPSLISLLANETLLRLVWPKRFPSKHRLPPGPIPVDSCIGACMIVRRKAIDSVGCLDERYFFFMEETDWQRRMWQGGWKVFFVPSARVVHAQGKSVGQSAVSRMLFYRSRYLYFRKWVPRQFPVFYGAIAFRLLVNSVLTLIGVLATLGLHPGLRHKLGVYGRLLRWHLQGCPPVVPEGKKEGADDR